MSLGEDFFSFATFNLSLKWKRDFDFKKDCYYSVWRGLNLLKKFYRKLFYARCYILIQDFKAEFFEDMAMTKKIPLFSYYDTKNE